MTDFNERTAKYMESLHRVMVEIEDPRYLPVPVNAGFAHAVAMAMAGLDERVEKLEAEAKAKDARISELERANKTWPEADCSGGR